MRAIIADDEKLLRDHLLRLLHRLWPELDVCAEASNGTEALEAILSLKPDIAFLDIRMPGLSGINVAKKVAANCSIVFITAYDQYAVTAFEHHAVDYLVKPLTEERLKETVSRLKRSSVVDEVSIKELFNHLAKPLTEPKQKLQWVRAQHGDTLQLIHVEDVLYFKAEDKYTIVRTGQNRHIIRMSLKMLEDELDRDLFWRIHRNSIVNVRKIDKVGKNFAGALTVNLIDTPETLDVSRSFAHLFHQM